MEGEGTGGKRKGQHRNSPRSPRIKHSGTSVPKQIFSLLWVGRWFSRPHSATQSAPSISISGSSGWFCSGKYTHTYTHKKWRYPVGHFLLLFTSHKMSNQNVSITKLKVILFTLHYCHIQKRLCFNYLCKMPTH